MVAPIQIRVHRLEIALCPQARDFAINLENRMRNLAHDHVDLVGMRGRHDHVSIFGTRTTQHRRIRGKANKSAHIHTLGGLANERWVIVDHCHIVALLGQMTSDLPTDLTCSTDDDAHIEDPF